VVRQAETGKQELKKNAQIQRKQKSKRGSQRRYKN
jgi:hypothetical protein